MYLRTEAGTDAYDECMADFDTPSRALADVEDGAPMARTLAPWLPRIMGLMLLWLARMALYWDGVEVTSLKGFTCFEEDATKKDRNLTMGFSYLVPTSVTKLSSQLMTENN